MHRLPHLSLQWFRPHPEVPCVATNLVGLILMFSAASQSQRPELLALLARLSCNQTSAAKISGRLRHPNMRNLIVITCSGRFPEFSPELARNCSGTSQEFPELPRNFRNSPGISGMLGSEIQGQTNSRIFFRNLPVISGTCLEFPELSRNFSGTFPELSQNFPGIFPELSRNFPGTLQTPEDLLGFLPNFFKNVTRAEPTQIF